MQMKLTVQQESIEEMTEKIEAITEELTKVHGDFLTFLEDGGQGPVEFGEKSIWTIKVRENLMQSYQPQGCLRFVIVVFPDHTHYF